MKWVLNTYQTAQDWDVDQMIEMCRKTGYQGIEFLQDFKQTHGWEWDTDAAHAASIRQKMSDAGLEIASLTSCQRFDSPEAAQRQASVDRVKRVIEMARDTGCPQVRVLGDRLPEDGTREQVFDNVAACLRELAQFAQPHGVRVAIEMHGSFTDPGAALTVMRRADHPNLGFVFNSQFRFKTPEGWAAPDPSQPPASRSIAPLWDEIGPYLCNVHTHQMERPDTLESYREMFHFLRRDGYEGYISNECAYRGPDPEKVLSMYTALYRAFAEG
jgi:sugar phosphate isomerase/epimerase